MSENDLVATDKNVGGTSDTISRQAAIDEVESLVDTMSVCISMDECKGMRRMKQSVLEKIKALPPAQPEPEEFEWCHTCREYDQEKHCCHRWTKVIRKTVDDMKAAQPGWIPVTERLPEKDGQYYVTQLRYGVYDSKMTGAYVRETNYIWYSVRHKRWSVMANCKVVAWIEELPKPWEGDANG